MGEDPAMSDGAGQRRGPKDRHPDKSTAWVHLDVP